MSTQTLRFECGCAEEYTYFEAVYYHLRQVQDISVCPTRCPEHEGLPVEDVIKIYRARHEIRRDVREANS